MVFELIKQPKERVKAVNDLALFTQERSQIYRVMFKVLKVNSSMIKQRRHKVLNINAITADGQKSQAEPLKSKQQEHK